jgi:hypothetical protein
MDAFCCDNRRRVEEMVASYAGMQKRRTEKAVRLGETGEYNGARARKHSSVPHAAAAATCLP